MWRTNLAALSFVLLALSLSSCGQTDGTGSVAGTNTGNPFSPEVAVKIIGTSNNTTTAKVDSKLLANGIDLTEARVVISSIRFRPLAFCQAGESEVEEDDFDFDGPFVVDLLSNTSIPTTDNVQLPAGSYCRVELKLDDLDDDVIPNGIDASDAIVDQAVILRGTTQGGRPFHVFIEDNDEFRLENKQNGFAIGGNTNLDQFFIVFDLDLWFANVDFDNVSEGQGVILIDEDNNEALHAKIVDNIKFSANLLKDLDGDSLLNDSEIDDDLVLAEGEDS